MTRSETMEFSVEDAGPCRKRVTVSIPTKLVSEQFKRSFTQWSNSSPIRGFRPGKAPRALVEKRFGKDIAIEVKRTLIDNAFDEALEANELAPIADPELDFDTVEVVAGQPIDFKFVVTVRPEFDLPDLGGIEVSVPAVDVSDDELAHALKKLQRHKATLRPLDHGAVEHGDVVTLKVAAMSADTGALDGSEMAYEIGSRHLGELITEDLDATLVGKEPGATVRTTGYVSPHAVQNPLAGQDVGLKVELIDVKRPELPSIDDNFAKELDFDSQEGLREAVRKDVTNRLARDRERLVEDAALAQLVRQVGIELPASLVEKETDETARRGAYGAQIRGDSADDVAKTIIDIRNRDAGESAKQLMAYLILDQIVDAERIVVTEDEVRDAVARIATHHDQVPEQLHAVLQASGRLGGLRNHLREKKARAKLRERIRATGAPR